LEGWLRIKQACQYCGVGERTLRSWLCEGLPYSKVKGVVLIKVENLDQFIERFAVTKDRVNEVVQEAMNGL